MCSFKMNNANTTEYNGCKHDTKLTVFAFKWLNAEESKTWGNAVKKIPRISNNAHEVESIAPLEELCK